MQSFLKGTTKNLIRLRGCAGSFESSLGAHDSEDTFSYVAVQSAIQAGRINV